METQIDKLKTVSFLLIYFSYLSSTVQAFGVKIECPDEFHNGPNDITCSINRTAIRDASCLSVSQLVTFDRTVGSQTTVVCMYNYDSAQPCIPETQHTAGKCWCNQSSGEVISYTFSYVGNSTLDEGGQLECKLCMLPENPLDVQVSKGCRHMTFASPYESHMTNSSNLDAGEEQPTSLPLAVGIAGGVIVTIVITMVVIFLKKRRHCCFVFKTERNPGDNLAKPKNKRNSPIEDQDTGKRTENGSPGHRPNGTVQQALLFDEFQ